jgi:hypothetical protein
VFFRVFRAFRKNKKKFFFALFFDFSDPDLGLRGKSRREKRTREPRKEPEKKAPFEKKSST